MIPEPSVRRPSGSGLIHIESIRYVSNIIAKCTKLIEATKLDFCPLRRTSQLMRIFPDASADLAEGGEGFEQEIAE